MSPRCSRCLRGNVPVRGTYWCWSCLRELAES